MGSLFSIIHHQQQEEDPRSLKELLELEQVPWNLVHARLHSVPEEAALYCHNVEPSPFMLALQKDGITTQVFDAFLHAHEDALYSLDSDGHNVLHFCNNSEIATKILRMCSGTVKQTSHQGQLALHMVRDTDTARVLIQAHRKSVNCRDVHGNTPLNCACHNDSVSPSTIRLLLLEESSSNSRRVVLSRNKSGITPLHGLCQRFERNTQERDELWEILVVAMASIHPEQPVLHSVVELQCPPSVVSHALTKCPGQTRIRNEDGKTPLLLAACSGNAQLIILLAHADPDAGRMVDLEGRLPIDIAAQFGLASSMAALVRAEPRAVDTRDLRDGLFPFLTAASAQDADLDTIYQLLKTKPHVLMYSQQVTSQEQDDAQEQDGENDQDPSKDKNDPSDSSSSSFPDKDTPPPEPPRPVLISEQGIQNNIGGHRAMTLSESDGALTDAIFLRDDDQQEEDFSSTLATENMLIDVE